MKPVSSPMAPEVQAAAVATVKPPEPVDIIIIIVLALHGSVVSSVLYRDIPI